MATGGDKNQSQALYLLGGKALWTKELEVALKENHVDMLVHSLKDVPTTVPEGCVIGAVLKREDPVGSLVVKQRENWQSLDDLPSGSVVGTNSVRRVAQLKRKHPYLKFLDVVSFIYFKFATKSNLPSARELESLDLLCTKVNPSLEFGRNTRLAKLDAVDGPYAALVLAKSGLVRLGTGDRATSDMLPPILYYAVSQGALAVEIRSDTEGIELCKKITHRDTLWRCMAERACFRVLEGGCSVPVGVESTLSTVNNSEILTLTGCHFGRWQRASSTYFEGDSYKPERRRESRREVSKGSDGNRCKENSR